MTRNDKRIINLAKKEGGYQDIMVNDRLIYKGWRECEDRYLHIKKHIKRNSVVMDIGSHYGYFAVRLAKEMGCLVWSIEPDVARSRIQKQILKANRASVALSQTKFDLIYWLRLARLAEGIDTILALSVFHYFEPEHIREIIWLMSLIAPNLIVEIPNINEKEVANKQNLRYFKYFDNYLDECYEKVEYIDISKAPNGRRKRKIMIASNSRIWKQGIISYKGARISKNHKMVYRNGWHIDGKKDWVKGLNLRNLLKTGLIYPEKGDIIRSAAEEYYRLIRADLPTDINLRNILLTKKGVKVIDYKEQKDQDKIYGVDALEYRKSMLSYDIDRLCLALSEGLRK